MNYLFVLFCLSLAHLCVAGPKEHSCNATTKEVNPSVISWKDLLVSKSDTENLDLILDKDRAWMSAEFTNARAFAQSALPKVFKVENTPAAFWRASNWSTTSVSNPPHAVLPNVGWSTKSLHRFSSSDRTMLQDELETHSSWKPHGKRDVLRKDLFSTCRHAGDTDDGHYHYLAGMLMPQSFGEITPYEKFIVPNDTQTESVSLDPSPSGPHPWVKNGLVTVSMFMGCAGSRTQLHYDEAHNFFFQLHGKKQFVLFPPETIPHFNMIPYGHPEYRQSGIPDLEIIDTAEHPSIVRALGTGRVIQLEAGEGLYVPPYWLHYVKSLSHSISIQFFTMASETTLMARQQQPEKLVFNQLHKIPLPFEQEWSEAEYGQHTFEYLCILLRDFESTEWWNQFFPLGFESLPPEDSTMRHYLTSQWKSVVYTLKPTSLLDLWNIPAGCCSSALSNPLRAPMLDKFRDRAEQIHAIVKQSKQELWLKSLYLYLDLVIGYTFSDMAIRYSATLVDKVCTI